MKLIPYEKSQDIIEMFALKSGVLLINSFGEIQPNKETILERKDYQLFGIQDSTGLFVGASDLLFNKKHGTAKAAIYLENSSVSLSSVVLYLKEYAINVGLMKISIFIFCSEQSIADTMKSCGFLPEIKHRSHLFIGGTLFPMTEYGCLL